ncbi:leucine efflux protein LeuE [Amorphoplanes digitatis]|uniref:Leucine efflux protein n=1 Tax=Actinoplanes digitatis TaxID=1868 RepID=A0A7W7HTH9_9ACTN|nr:leucine efflux protein LeuE [Actinoplanes digitatis]MBB4760471.1 leucine efflux protein [Actinoplanes digitatis]GID95428.1 leucine efflux protein [Actinoplanes digitatis]
MLGITDFWTYVLGTVAIVLLPGPNSIFVLTVGAQRGVRMGYRAAAGVFVGDTVLMVLAAAGVASLLRTYPPVFMVIKYAGAAYLAWVGFGIIRSGWRKLRNRGAEPAARAASGPTGEITGPAGVATNGMAANSPAGMGANGPAGMASDPASGAGVPAGMRRPFRRALVVSLLNPKAILFVVSFFIQFVEPGYAHPALSFLILGAVLQVFSVLYLTALIFGGQFLAGQFRRRRRLAAGASAGIGAVFVGFGIKLATASVS